ncbi:MAG: hypothetical protein KF751_09620 [Nitrospira sp.]|nr:hypothetical protein [Nitrospira sp.]MBX3349477.1 hypothetical protein [Nitrospira sp.]
MVARHGETEQAILQMLQRRRVMMMDDVLAIGHSDFAWSELFLAIDRLSRKQLIALYRTGSTYQLTFNRPEHQ